MVTGGEFCLTAADYHRIEILRFGDEPPGAVTHVGLPVHCSLLVFGVGSGHSSGPVICEGAGTSQRSSGFVSSSTGFGASKVEADPVRQAVVHWCLLVAGAGLCYR